MAQMVNNSPAMQETRMDSWVRKIPWRRDRLPSPVFLGFPGGSAGKESDCNAGDLGWEDPLEKGMATHSSALAWRIPMERAAWQATVHGVAKSWTWQKWLSTAQLMLGKTEGRKRKGQGRMRWLASITNSINRNLSKLWETVKDRRA